MNHTFRAIPTLHVNIKFAVCWKADKQHSTTVSSSSTWLTHTYTQTHKLQDRSELSTVCPTSPTSYYLSHTCTVIHTRKPVEIQKVTFSWQMQSLTGAPVCPASSVEPQVYTEILVHPHIFCLSKVSIYSLQWVCPSFTCTESSVMSVS